MFVTSAQQLTVSRRISEGDTPMAKIIATSQTGFTRFFAGFRRRHPYRWYKVEVACF